jgi:hypothetical protein
LFVLVVVRLVDFSDRRARDYAIELR